MKSLVIFTFICVNFYAHSFELRFNNKNTTHKISFIPQIVEKQKVYISKDCNKQCMAFKKFNKKKCNGKSLRAIRNNGTFEQVCYFNDNSSHLQ